MKQQIETWVDAHQDEIIAETQTVLRIPSVEEETTRGAGAPFGRPLADALEHTLALCARLGMKTENFDGYAGHAEFGEGEEIVAMLGHLDVVPPGTGWTKEPFGAVIEDGQLYARGASDDKGPTFAALFGAKAVLDGLAASGEKLSRRVRLIFGCDEESGWQCMDHYFGAAGQPKPDLAFTPDAEFPLIYAEKGAFTGIATRTVESSNGGGALSVAAFQSGLRVNMVPGDAEATLTGDDSALHAAAERLAGTPYVTVEPVGDDGLLRVHAKGRAAHASTPDHGENAAVRLLQALSSLPGLADADRAWAADLAARAPTDGSGVNIAGRDDVSGPLTCNLGIVSKQNGQVRASFNVRYPVTHDGDDLRSRFTAALVPAGWQTEFVGGMEPLFVPQDEEPVKTLLRVYREHTGDLSAPRTMGGRTYATAVAPRGVAFGAALPGDPEVAHQADEHIAVARILQCAKIYGHALYELAK